MNTTSSLEGFTVRHQIIEHEAFQTGMARIEAVHRRYKASGIPNGLLITGLSGSGKSTLRDEYLARYPRIDCGVTDYVPVLSVDTPTAPTVKNLAEAILISLGDPAAHKGSAEEKTRRIYDLLKLCKVELVIIDEFQHFAEHGRRSEVARVSDWLKSLINKAGIPVILMGLPSCEQTLASNIQLARRFSARYYLKPFSMHSPADTQRFRSLLNAMQRMLPFSSTSISTREMATRFFYATYGLIDYVAKIVDSAVQKVFGRRGRQIEMLDYADAFREEVWSEAPDSLNPFSGDDNIRLLNRLGEPFHDVETQTHGKVGKSRKETIPL